MSHGNARENTDRPPAAADRVRRAIDGGGERVWSVQDFPGLPFPAVAQTLSRLARARRTSSGSRRGSTTGPARPPSA